MGADEVEIVRRGYDSLLSGDFDALDELCTPDVVIVQPPEVPDTKTYEGRGAVRRAMEDWPQQWEDFQMELVDLVDVGDGVVVGVTHHHGRGRESGIEMDFEVAYVHRLRDGKLERLEMYFGRDRALEAAATP